MKLEIKKGEKEERLKEPHYLLKIIYMFGDADGSDETELTFMMDEVESLKDYIMVHEICNNIFPHGRGGYDEHDHVPEFCAVYEEYLSDDHFENEGWEDYEIEIYKKYQAKDMHLYLPSYEGISYSFDGYEVQYVDENGDKFDVEVTFTPEEIERILDVNPRNRKYGKK